MTGSAASLFSRRGTRSSSRAAHSSDSVAAAMAGLDTGRLVGRAGTPTAVHPAGTSWSTTAPAPTRAPSPTVMEPSMRACVPRTTRLPIVGWRLNSVHR